MLIGIFKWLCDSSLFGMIQYHKHVCPGCDDSTIHHVFPHESKGDIVEFWCEHCDKDVNGKIGEYSH